MNVVDLAWEIHKNDKYGEYGYMYHLWGVYNTAVHLYGEEWAEKNKTLLFLHDAIEDHPECTSLIAEHIGEDILIHLLILDKNEYASREHYLRSLVELYQGVYLQVKICDMMSNLKESLASADIRRIKKYTGELNYLLQGEQL